MGHMTCLEGKRKCVHDLVGELEEKDYLEDQSIDRITSKWILRK
jgi:hypothetical protein